VTSSEVGQAKLRPGGQLGEPDAVDTHVAEDVQVRRPQVGVAVIGGGSGQLGPELMKQPDQKPADGEPVRGQIGGQVGGQVT